MIHWLISKLLFICFDDNKLTSFADKPFGASSVEMSAILHQTRLLVAKQEKLLANKFGYQCLSYFSPHFCNTLLKTQSPWAHNSIQAANSRNLQFYVPDPKHGYVKDDRTFKEKYVESLKLLKTEVNMWKDEMAEQIKNDPMLVLPPG